MGRTSPIYPDKDKGFIVEELTEYYNCISFKYSRLNMEEVPSTFKSVMPLLTEDQVEERIKKAKKPSSVVPGDLPPTLLSKFARKLAVPVTRIFNLMTQQLAWPEDWRKEYVTVIPKVCLSAGIFPALISFLNSMNHLCLNGAGRRSGPS